MPVSSFQTFVNLLSASKPNKSYTLLLGSGLSFTPTILQTTHCTSWSKFYDFIERLSQEECTAILRKHFATLQLSDGYAYIIRLILAGYFKAVFTINVDSFLKVALEQFSHESQQINLIIRGQHTDTHLITNLQHSASGQTVVCMLRGEINGKYYVKLSDIANFPEPLKSEVTNYLSRDILVAGSISNYDMDIMSCIPKSGGSIWYISPDKGNKRSITLPFERYNGNIIKGDYADFNYFFYKLLEELKRAEDKEEKNHAPKSFVSMIDPTIKKQILEDRVSMKHKDFFISYNSRDRKWSEWIAWTLEQAGYSVFIQAWDFLPGGNFVLDMQRAASQSKTTIAVLSEDYLQATFTQPEWAAAFVQDPTGKDRKLIPVRVRECEPAGLLKAIVHIDLVGVEEAEAKRLLLEGVKSLRNKPDVSPLFPGQPEPEIDLAAAIKGDPLLPKHPPYPKNLPPTKVVNVFYVYSPKDERFREQIEAQLALLRERGLISEWHSGKLIAGTERADEIRKYWQKAEVILLLVSADFLSSNNYALARKAMERHEARTAVVIPIILRPVDWEDAIFSQIYVLPDNQLPITSWANRDEALLNVAKGIRKAIEKFTDPNKV